MALRTRIDFTERELEALSGLMANTVDFDSFMEDYPGLDRIERAALHRCSDKIGRAHRKATTGSGADPDVYCNRCENRGATTPGHAGKDFGCPGCGHLLGQHPNRVGQ